MGAQETVNVIVCDCGEADVCPARGPLSTSLGAAGVGSVILGLIIFLCEYRAVNGYINETTKFLLNKPTVIKGPGSSLKTQHVLKCYFDVCLQCCYSSLYVSVDKGR